MVNSHFLYSPLFMLTCEVGEADSNWLKVTQEASWVPHLNMDVPGLCPAFEPLLHRHTCNSIMTRKLKFCFKQFLSPGIILDQAFSPPPNYLQIVIRIKLNDICLPEPTRIKANKAINLEIFL